MIMFKMKAFFVFLVTGEYYDGTQIISDRAIDLMGIKYDLKRRKSIL